MAQKRMPPFKPISLLSLLLIISCGHGKAGEEPEPKTSFVRGDVSKSPSRRTSEERPQPWDEEKRRFQEDGLNLDGYEEKVRSEHAESHGRSNLSMESFSHPACAALKKEDRTVCPLLRLTWSAFREVPGGATISVGAEQKAVRWLRWLVLCHVAFGKAQGHKRGCPFHLPGVRARVLWEKGRAALLLTTEDKDRVGELRDRLEHLVP